MESVEPRHSDSSFPISEPPEITNWFSSYVYESFPLCSSLVNESEIESHIEEDKENLDVVDVTDNNKEKFVSTKDHHHKPIYNNKKMISDRNLYDSLPSEPPDICNWFSSYVYESPTLDTSHGLEFSVPGESECIKETETYEMGTNVDRNNVCLRLSEKEFVSSLKVTDSSQSQFLSEPPDVRNWFSNYEYQSPQFSETHELGFSSFEKDQLIIEESDTEEENSSGIFRKAKSKQESIALGRLNSNDYKENIAKDMVNEVSSNRAYSDQEMEKKSSVGSLNASQKEAKQESSFKQESLLCKPKQEPRFSLGVSCYNSKPQSPSKNKASLHELRQTHIQETIPMNSNREEEDQETVDQESDDKENVEGKNTETGFVATKKARFRETRDQSSITKPNTEVLVRCSRSKELKNITKEEDKEERKKKKRRVLGEMSNQQFPQAKEVPGKWRCPQKNKGNLAPPLKQLRLNKWIHKV